MTWASANNTVVSSSQVAAALSQTIVGQKLYPQTPAESNAGSAVVNDFRLPGDVRRYGTVGAGNDATAVVQAAINQAMETDGDAWFIPRGVTCEIETSGSTVTPVGDALTITASCQGRIDGVLVAQNNCNAIHVSGDDVDLDGAGSIEGYGTFFQTGSDNGALVKDTGNRNSIRVARYVDPPQYGVLRRASAAKVGGDITGTVVGGPTSHTGDQHYGVEVEGLVSGGSVDVEIRAAAGGVCVQGFATGTTLGTPADMVVNVIGRDCWDHATYARTNNCEYPSLAAYRTGGSGIRLLGVGNHVGSIYGEACAEGVADLQSFSNGSVGSVTGIDYEGVAFSLQPQNGDASDGVISNVDIGPIIALGKSADTDVRTAVRVVCLESSGATETSQENITIASVTATDAAQSATAEPAVHLQVGTGKTLSRVRIGRALIDTCGYQGFAKQGAGELVDCDIENILVRNPGSAASAAGSDTHAFRINAGTVTRGKLRNLTAVDDRSGAEKMVNGFSAAGTVAADVDVDGLVSVGHTGAPGTLAVDGYTDGDTTPSVRGRKTLHIANAAATTITNFDDGIEGQVITLTFADANTTVNRANAALAGGANFVSTANDVLVLIKRGALWVELTRSANS